MANKIHIEVFVAPHCNKCGRSVVLLAALHQELSDMFDWRVVDVVDELDHAVETGIRATPGIAINGQLIFTAQPSEKKLRESILQAHKQQ